MKTTYLLIVAVILLQACNPNDQPIYKNVRSDKTGVTFSNTITYADSLSVIDFEYMYNGGGVAVGDINNDGLQDLFFTGNMVTSKLYLNKGNWKFEDITAKAGLTTNTWANGVSMVDINQDGFKDIYVNVGGNRNTPESERTNLLFINNGDLTFSEQAAKYNLNDKGYGIQSVFFDYDLDGDLDMYLLRNSFVTYSRNASRPKSVKGEAASTDKLFRNNGDNTFTDVSAEAGILIEGFGLGVSVSDINEDGWPDVYVSNDFITNDLLWINNQDGTFTNRASEYIKHQTFNGMGNDVADYNNDGLVDIVVVDMLPEDNTRWKLTPRGNGYDEFENGLRIGYEPQYVRNTLQLNNGTGTFSEIGQLAGIEATEWSWGALFADYNNDGLKDLFITNGYGKDITNLDFIMYSDEKQNMGLPVASRKERQDLLNELPGISIHNYMYQNKGDLTFSDVSDNWGFSEPTFSNGVAYADLDNDGDLDLVINNIDGEASLLQSNLSELNAGSNNYLRIAFEGSEKNKEGLGAKVYIKSNGALQYQYYSPVRGYLSSVEPFLHFGLGSTSMIDSLEVVWPDGAYQVLTKINSNQLIALKHSNAIQKFEYKRPKRTKLFSEITNTGIDFIHKENSFIDFKIQPALPHMNSKNGPGISVADINGDSREDIFIGAAIGYTGGLYLQKADSKFVKQTTPWLDSLSEDMGVLFFDADSDKDLDLYVVSGGTEQQELDSILYQDRLFINDGTGNFKLNQQALPVETASGSCVVGADYDRDGDIDLFIGGRVTPSKYPMPPSSYLFRNDSGNGLVKFTNITQQVPELERTGMVCTAMWTDFDNDGWIDLILSGEFLPIRFYRNVKGEFEQPIEIENSKGWWNSITSGDFDKDGDVDYIVGNLGLNSHFKATPDEPLCIHAKDFNKDGRIDPIMSYYTQGVNYVGHPRDVLTDQINSMRGRFRTFTAYANATFEESFLPEELEDAYVVCAQTFESSYLENVGKGKFIMSPLPLQAQFAPLYGMITEDFDEDGNLDVLLSGNSYSPEVLSGRDDSFTGLLLKGDGKGKFKPEISANSGFVSDLDSKGIAKMVLSNDSVLVVVGNNSQKIKTYTQPNKVKYIKANNNDSFAIITLVDGTRYRYEFNYGSTYLSQSSRTLRITPAIKAVDITDFKGVSRSVKLR